MASGKWLWISYVVVQSLSCVQLFATPFLSCPSPSPGVCSNSYPLSRWHHPTISSCHPLLLLPSIFPSFRVFSVSRLFTSGGQSIRASTSASVLPVNIQGWFPLGMTGLISLQFKGLSRFLSSEYLCITITTTNRRSLYYLWVRWPWVNSLRLWATIFSPAKWGL